MRGHIKYGRLGQVFPQQSADSIGYELGSVAVEIHRPVVECGVQAGGDAIIEVDEVLPVAQPVYLLFQPFRIRIGREAGSLYEVHLFQLNVFLVVWEQIFRLFADFFCNGFGGTLQEFEHGNNLHGHLSDKPAFNLSLPGHGICRLTF